MSFMRIALREVGPALASVLLKAFSQEGEFRSGRHCEAAAGRRSNPLAGDCFGVLRTPRNDVIWLSAAAAPCSPHGAKRGRRSRIAALTRLHPGYGTFAFGSRPDIRMMKISTSATVL
jgi:hypothetical protein